MTSLIDVDLGKDGGLGGVHHRTLRTPGWLKNQTSNWLRNRTLLTNGRLPWCPIRKIGFRQAARNTDVPPEIGPELGFGSKEGGRSTRLASFPLKLSQYPFSHRITALLRHVGWNVKHKRVARGLGN